MNKIAELTNGEMADITINNVNVPDRDDKHTPHQNTGIVYFSAWLPV